MKMTNLSLLTIGCGNLILSASADAAYTHLYLEPSDAFFSNHPNLTIRNAWNAGPVNQYDIYRLYANFTSNTPADRVNGAGGIPGSPFSVTLIGGTFYNYTDGQGAHYNIPGLSPAQRAWDTWVTVGSATNVPVIFNFSPGFDTQTNNLGRNSSTIGPTTIATWQIQPDDPIGQAVASAPNQANAPPGTFRVLLAQFTVTQGTISIVGNLAVGLGPSTMLNQTFAIPAPGAMALLGLAGLVGARRRRDARHHIIRKRGDA